MADRQEKVDSFKDALHDLVTEAADHLPEEYVIASLQTETHRLQNQLHSHFNKGRSSKMHASLHRVTKITLREIKPLRKNGGEEGPIMSYVRYIQIEYEDDATLDVVCHSDDPRRPLPPLATNRSQPMSETIHVDPFTRIRTTLNAGFNAYNFRWSIHRVRLSRFPRLRDSRHGAHCWRARDQRHIARHCGKYGEDVLPYRSLGGRGNSMKVREPSTLLVQERKTA